MPHFRNSKKWMPSRAEVEQYAKEPFCFGEDRSFNEHHPELRPGEEFHTNIDPEMLENEFPEYKKPPYRIGKQTYDKNGNAYSGSVPVFRKKGAKAKDE